MGSRVVTDEIDEESCNIAISIASGKAQVSPVYIVGLGCLGYPRFTASKS